MVLLQSRRPHTDFHTLLVHCSWFSSYHVQHSKELILSISFYVPLLFLYLGPLSIGLNDLAIQHILINRLVTFYILGIQISNSLCFYFQFLASIKMLRSITIINNLAESVLRSFNSCLYRLACCPTGDGYAISTGFSRFPGVGRCWVMNFRIG